MKLIKVNQSMDRKDYDQGFLVKQKKMVINFVHQNEQSTGLIEISSRNCFTKLFSLCFLYPAICLEYENRCLVISLWGLNKVTRSLSFVLR